MQSGTPDNFSHALLYSGEYVCVMRRGHPLVRDLNASPLTLDAYCRKRASAGQFSGRPLGFVDQARRAINRTRRVVITVNQFFHGRSCRGWLRSADSAAGTSCRQPACGRTAGGWSCRSGAAGGGTWSGTGVRRWRATLAAREAISEVARSWSPITAASRGSMMRSDTEEEAAPGMGSHVFQERGMYADVAVAQISPSR